MRQVLPQHDLQPTIAYLPMVGSAAVEGHGRRAAVPGETYEGRQLGQYRLQRRLGSGGMGEVYQAEHMLLRRLCAVKLIRPSTALDAATLARFEREVRSAARLTHWNVVQIHDCGRTHDGTFYYVMELLPGLDLYELVKRHGALPPARVVHLVSQTCNALQEAHGIGLVHRDIKPANVFAAQRGRFNDVAKLLDFGLVRERPRRELDNKQLSGKQLSDEQGLSGSPLYMSPEQAAAFELADARSDIYSLGAVAYYLLTGSPPFVGDSPLEVIAAHARAEVVPPSTRRHDMPRDLEQVVLRCLEKDPLDRFPDAKSLRAALLACGCAGQWTDRHAEAWWRDVSR